MYLNTLVVKIKMEKVYLHQMKMIVQHSYQQGELVIVTNLLAHGHRVVREMITHGLKFLHKTQKRGLKDLLAVDSPKLRRTLMPLVMIFQTQQRQLMKLVRA